MSEYYVLVDKNNRDDDGNEFRLEATTLAEFVPYVDGPLRDDMIGPKVREYCDEIIDHLRQERFDLAEQMLSEVGVRLFLEWDVSGDD